MNDAEIQIQFPRPGQWDEFILTPIYRDKSGYRPPARYTADEIPAEQAPAMAAVVAALVGLAEPWQASQVWARRNWVLRFSRGDAGSYQTKEVVILTVEAINAQGGRIPFLCSQGFRLRGVFPLFHSILIPSNGL